MKDVRYPICPLNLYFEGDEDKCDQNECDYDCLGLCTQSCERILPDLSKTYRLFKEFVIDSVIKYDRDGNQDKSEIICGVGCNGEEHAIQVTEMFYINGQVVHGQWISESKIGKCTCMATELGGFILNSDLEKE